MQLDIFISVDDLKRLEEGESVTIIRGATAFLPYSIDDRIVLHKDDISKGETKWQEKLQKE